MPVSVNSLLKLYPDAKVSHGINGMEIILRECPLDYRGLGRMHPDYKLYLNPLLGVGKCFVCHGPGEGDTVEHIVGRRLPSVESPGATAPAWRPPVKDLPNCRLLTDLPEGHVALDYLKERRVTPQIAHLCGLMWKDVYDHAWMEGNDPKLRGVGGLVIPMRVRGELLAWQLGPVPRVEHLPKYINAPNSNMSRGVFNWDNVYGSDVLVIVEGVFDALRIPDIAIGLMGNAVTEGKQRLISTGGFSQIILCMDGDIPQTIIRKNLDKLAGSARIVRHVQLPDDGRDPAEYDEDELRGILDV